ncbi:TIR domain-containing protein [Tenacibaculum amylolyticum]|uniref:TIR domain-containing protein n=1 Tax=Tenacibaculum amylolyticum TaxID=104269 RepID=UPI003895DA40
MTKRKTFISHYHEDAYYKELFEKLFKDIIVNKSVKPGDINSNNSDDYTKQLIQKEYLKETTVLVVLVGPKTKCRKHVDWEISGALNYKVGNLYSGLVGILLPEHPDYKRPFYNDYNIPERLLTNVKTGYAKIHNWTTNESEMMEIINDTFYRRKSHANERVNNLPQMRENTCG